MEHRNWVVACIALSTIFLITTPPALGQGVTGDCTAQVNGRPVATLTEDKPLKVRRNEKIAFDGRATIATNMNVRSSTKFYVVLFGARVPLADRKGNLTDWGGRIELPGYLKSLAAGTYRIEAEAEGNPSSYRCEASGYVELKGGPLTFALGIGALVAAVGAAVALGARGNAANAPDKGTIARKTGIEDRGVKVVADKLRTRGLDLAYLAAIALVFYLAYEGLLDLGDSLGFAVPAAAASGQRRVWVHGRVIRGFIGGFLLGVGGALVLHQLDVWPLDLTQGLVFPVLLGVVSAARAYLGSAFIVTPPPPQVDDRASAAEQTQVMASPTSERQDPPPDTTAGRADKK